MVPEKQWRDKGDMMDKRTARKVHGTDFRAVIANLRHEFQLSRRDDSEQRNDKSAMQVVIRKRPMLAHEPKKKEFDVVTCVGDHTVVVHDCQMYADMKRKFIENRSRPFSKVFSETASTDQVFDDVAKPLVEHAIDGGQSVIMMYGQTGSGKTHTMQGLYKKMADMIFGNNVGDDLRVIVTAVEIAGAKCFDLLRRRQKVSVCDTNGGDSKLLNVTERNVDSSARLVETIQEALAQRATEATAVNSVSSRSHFLCRLGLVDKRKRGQLTLLDLAGSERNEDSFHHTADRRREAIEINSSHLALKQCVQALGQQDTTGFVPYRASTLTRLLKDSLWAKDARAAVIATISPIATDTEHTLHTLQYASMMLVDAPEEIKEQVEVPTAVEEAKTKVRVKTKRAKQILTGEFQAIKDWDNSDVIEWWQSLKRGLFTKYSSNLRGVDGKMLLRLGLPRIIQLCNSNAIDGEAVFKCLQKEKAQDDKADKERRLRNAAARKK
ncbi:hypothetical protein Ae201684_001743 [Aphanomyces euteiches]|uniref:Kinesin motor domain-containing protein n=1 Tax=Aphanomyces euteiches TaxID=100861 RepID=A0A6G0XSK6_9STRA|nr:hypothetical protein Ae201684_001743 [Aphanomyces euteiches]